MARLKSVTDDVDALRHQIAALERENYELKMMCEKAKAEAAQAQDLYDSRNDTLDAYEAKFKQFKAVIKDMLYEEFTRKRGLDL